MENISLYSSEKFRRIVDDFHNYYYMPSHEMEDAFQHFHQLLKDMQSCVVPSYARKTKAKKCHQMNLSEEEEEEEEAGGGGGGAFK